MELDPEKMARDYVMQIINEDAAKLHEQILERNPTAQELSLIMGLICAHIKFNAPGVQAEMISNFEGWLDTMLAAIREEEAENAEQHRQADKGTEQ